MESVRIKAYLFALSTWMVCGGYAQSNGTDRSDPEDGELPGMSAGVPFQPHIAGVIIILTTLCVVTIIILLLYCKHRRRFAGIRRHSRGGGTRGVRGSSGRAWPGFSADELSTDDESGMERSVIDALPVFKFGSLQGMKEGLECAVCLSRFEGSEVLRLLPKCRHAFHVRCVDTWLETNSTCPLCRQKVEAEDVSMVYRNEDVEEAKGLEDRGPQLLQAFVQRENVDSVERESESFRVPAGSFSEPSWRSEAVGSTGCFGSGRKKEPLISEADEESKGLRFVGSTGCFGSGRKKELLISEADEESKGLRFSRRFAHRIVVADVMGQHRWSDIKHSDLLFLSSQMITTDSGRMAFADVKPADEIETKSRSTTETAEIPNGYSAEIDRKRSMSEIIGFNRIKSQGRSYNTLLPITRFGERNEQKWFSIAGNTVQLLGGRGGGSRTDKFVY